MQHTSSAVCPGGSRSGLKTSLSALQKAGRTDEALEIFDQVGRQPACLTAYLLAYLHSNAMYV